MSDSKFISTKQFNVQQRRSSCNGIVIRTCWIDDCVSEVTSEISWSSSNHARSVIGNRYQLPSGKDPTSVSEPNEPVQVMYQWRTCSNFCKALLPRIHGRNDLISEAHFLVLLVTFSCASKPDSMSLRDTPAILYLILVPGEGAVAEQLEGIRKVCWR